MKISKIFRRAAEVYANPERKASKSGCCMAIGHVEEPTWHVGHYDTETPAQLFFKAIFGPRKSGWWWAYYVDNNFEEHRTPRVLALLFAAEMAEEEGQ